MTSQLYEWQREVFMRSLDRAAGRVSEDFGKDADVAAGLLSSIGLQLYDAVPEEPRERVYELGDTRRIESDLRTIALIASDYNGRSVEVLKFFDKIAKGRLNRILPRGFFLPPCRLDCDFVGDRYDQFRAAYHVNPTTVQLQKMIDEPLSRLRDLFGGTVLQQTGRKPDLALGGGAERASSSARFHRSLTERQSIKAAEIAFDGFVESQCELPSEDEIF
jgi:hypothetical protein